MLEEMTGLVWYAIPLLFVAAAAYELDRIIRRG